MLAWMEPEAAVVPLATMHCPVAISDAVADSVRVYVVDESTTKLDGAELLAPAAGCTVMVEPETAVTEP